MSEVVASTDTVPTEVTQDERTMALLAHLSPILVGFWGPLILFLVKKDESEFVAYHSMQALVYQIAVLAFIFIIGMPIIFCTFGLGTPIVFIPHILSVMHAIKANNGEWVGYPGMDQIGRPQGQ